MSGSYVLPILFLAALLGCDERGASRPAPSALGSSSSGRPRPIDNELWAALRSGSFIMGSPETERCRDPDETQAKMILTRPFVIAKREVTQRAFAQAMGYNPSFRKDCDNCPVDSVSQHEATAYCNDLSARQGFPECYHCSGREAATRCKELAQGSSCLGYRLPTEAEWEYAARATTKTANYVGAIRSCMGTDEATHRIAWYKASSVGRSHPTGEKEPNPWGLFDTLGNVYEWTSDWYAAKLVAGRDPTGPEHGEERVLRGGSWYHNAEHARSANRYAFRPDKRLSYAGFRCARTIN